MPTIDTSDINLVGWEEPAVPGSWLVSDWVTTITSNMAFEKDNVVLAPDGTLQFILSKAPDGAARPYNGAEIRSNDTASVGTFSWTVQVPEMVDGAVFGLYTYRADHDNDPYIEFDFEFVGSNTSQVQLNIHMDAANGEKVTLQQLNDGQPIIVDLGFDASQGMHTYEMVITGSEAIFIVDGKVVGRFDASDMPYGTWITGEMRNFVNLWSVDTPLLEDWAGKWVYPGEPLVAKVASVGLQANEFGSFGPAIPDPGIEGTPSDDVLSGTDDDDLISGQGGDDTLSGSSGDDSLSGGEGDDTLDLDDGNDLIDGGLGIDWIRAPGVQAATIDLSSAASQHTGYGQDTIRNVENAGGGSGNDTLLGTDGTNILSGGAGDDRLVGRGGADTLSGGEGHDRLEGGRGDDLLHGQAGNDTLDGGMGSDTLIGGAGDDLYLVDSRADCAIETTTVGGTMDAGGMDTVRASVSVTLGSFIENLELTGNGSLTGNGNVLSNLMTGNAGANTLNGHHGDDTIRGMGGADRIVGGAGNDRLEGGAGDDRLYARSGADRLEGGAGRDQLHGGTDAQGDIFVFARASDSSAGRARDTIYNFSPGADIIDLRGIDAMTGTAAHDVLLWAGGAARANSVWWSATREGLVLNADVTGDTTAEFQVVLRGVQIIEPGSVWL